MTTLLTYNQPGHVDQKTGRMAITVEDALSRPDVDSPLYWFNTENHACGLEGWRTIDGLDPHIKKPLVDVWFADGGMRTVNRSDCVYLGKRETLTRMLEKIEKDAEYLQEIFGMLSAATSEAAASLHVAKALLESNK